MLRGCVIGIVLLRGLPAQCQDADAARLLEEANTSYRQLRSDDAVRLYRDYLKLCPQRADVRVFLGAALLNLNRLDEALAEAQRALKQDARMAKAYVLEGRVYSARQQWDLAAGCFEKAVALQPNDSDAWYFAGRAACEADHCQKAVEDFRSALQFAPRESRVYEGLGLAYETLGQSAEAERAYRQALQLESSSYRPAFALGQFLFKQGRGPESLPYFETALRLAPDSAEVRFEFGRALYQMGKGSQAKQILEQGLPTHDCRLYNLLAKILRQGGEGADADRQLAAWRRCVSEPN
ncbi:MAG TPA: tetratricopeptide repeat protein [Bryobacteraceae bacterium]|nr:tetratricopeptide repeat protein [Bryobacteraceae bacterium]